MLKIFLGGDVFLKSGGFFCRCGSWESGQPVFPRKGKKPQPRMHTSNSNLLRFRPTLSRLRQRSFICIPPSPVPKKKIPCFVHAGTHTKWADGEGWKFTFKYTLYTFLRRKKRVCVLSQEISSRLPISWLWKISRGISYAISFLLEYLNFRANFLATFLFPPYANPNRTCP